MPRDFLPRRESELIVWSGHFRDGIADLGEAVSLSPEQCALYALKHDAFAQAAREAGDPTTRTSPTIALRENLRADLEAYARELARIVRAAPQVTDAPVKQDYGAYETDVH